MRFAGFEGPPSATQYMLSPKRAYVFPYSLLYVREMVVFGPDKFLEIFSLVISMDG